MAEPNQQNVVLYSFNNPSNSFQLSADFRGSCKSVGGYEKLNRVGEGTYGIVYRAKYDEKIVALKRIRIYDDQEGFPVSALREISLLKNLDHPNIVKVMDVVVGSGLDNIFMVMEYCEQDLAYLMDNVISKGRGYTLSQVKCLLLQLLQGVSYLHNDNNIIHRDLKLSNLLLNSQGVLKIADFGLARLYGDPIQSMTPKVVTLWYRAPEVLFGSEDYTEAIDLWSVGCIFGELLNSTPLLPGKNEPHQILLICKLLGTPSKDIWPELPSMPLYDIIKFPKIPYDTLYKVFEQHPTSCVRLLKKFLVYRPQKRINALNAIRDDFFEEYPKACTPIMLPTYPEVRNFKKLENSVDDTHSAKKLKLNK